MKRIDIEISRLIGAIVFAAVFGIIISMLVTFDAAEAAAVEDNANEIIISQTVNGDIGKVAEIYLETGKFSEQGLIDTLVKYEHFDEEETADIVHRMDVDWQAQAIGEVEDYLNSNGNSEKNIRQYLSRDLYTEEQIDKAIEVVDPDWTKQAEIRIDMLKGFGITGKVNLKANLLSAGFDLETVEKVL